jgi:hypothetical protein
MAGAAAHDRRSLLYLLNLAGDRDGHHSGTYGRSPLRSGHPRKSDSIRLAVGLKRLSILFVVANHHRPSPVGNHLSAPIFDYLDIVEGVLYGRGATVAFAL